MPLAVLQRARVPVPAAGPNVTPLPAAFEAEVASLEAELAADPRQSPAGPLPRSLVRRLLLDRSGYLQRTLLDEADGPWAGRIEAAQARLAAAGCPVPAVETSARYDWARRVLEGVVVEPGSYQTTHTDRIDRVLTHRLWGTLIFALVMLAVFQSVFVWARPAMEWIETLTAAAGGWLTAHMAEGRAAKPAGRRRARRRRAASSPSCRKSSSSSASSPCWKTAATWPGPPTSWTG